jgi:hypothetical protein
MALPTLRYQIGGAGWPVNGGALLLTSGTLIDTSLPQWAFLASTPPPIDAIAQDQATWNYMTSSNGVVGLCGYPAWRVNAVPGVARS